jgi:hypothetical protein
MVWDNPAAFLGQSPKFAFAPERETAIAD